MNGTARDWRTMGEAYAAFWRDAGVDLAFADEPRDWLADHAATTAEPAPFVPPVVELPPARPIGPAAGDVAPVANDRSGWPGALGDFAEWWMNEPTLDTGPAQQRVPPRGEARAELMVIVAQPEASDSDRLLSGPEGALLDAIERAMGLSPGTAYRASALPRVTPAADWDAIAAAGMGAVLRHHVALVNPARLLVLSQEARKLLAPDEFSRDGVGFVAIGERSIPLLSSYPLAQMAPRPGYKRIFWARWLDFARGN